MENKYPNYLKYKNKYLNLKQHNQRNNQNGGFSFENQDFNLLDEIHFWSNQMKEHALFLHLGLEQEDLKKEALVLHKEWVDFMNFHFKPRQIDDNKIFLDKEDLGKLDKDKQRIITDTKTHLEKLKVFKTKVLQLLSEGKWIGWIYPAFAEHVLLELNFLLELINNQKKDKNELVKFFNLHNSQEAGLTAHLLDPSEKDLVKTAQDFQNLFEQMSDGEQKTFYELSLKNQKELNEFAKNTNNNLKSIKSIINPTLIAHVIREGARAEKIQEFLNR